MFNMFRGEIRITCAVVCLRPGLLGTHRRWGGGCRSAWFEDPNPPLGGGAAWLKQESEKAAGPSRKDGFYFTDLL